MKRLLAFVCVLVSLIPCVGQDKKAPRADDLATRARSVLAQTSRRIELTGLGQPVEVLRDSCGVAHIYAQRVEDLFFAQGFVAAQDRLWQSVARRSKSRLAGGCCCCPKSQVRPQQNSNRNDCVWVHGTLADLTIT
jgi:acyl-homoserine lactone acylase PvdQ